MAQRSQDRSAFEAMELKDAGKIEPRNIGTRGWYGTGSGRDRFLAQRQPAANAPRRSTNR